MIRSTLCRSSRVPRLARIAADLCDARRALALVAGIAGAALGAPSAHALVIPDAHYELHAGNGPSSNSLYPTLGVGSVSGSYATISGGVQIGTESSSASMDGPLVSISGSSVGLSPTYLSSAMGIIQYYYAVIGPATVSVPLLISGSVSTSVSGGDVGGTQTGATALLSWTYETDSLGGVIRACSTLSGVSCGYSATASVTDHAFTVMSMSVMGIALRVDGGSGYSVNGSSYSAFADPLISIDPTWLRDHPGYSLEFSANIALPANGVPTPETAPLLTVGLGALVVGARRRARRTAQPLRQMSA